MCRFGQKFNLENDQLIYRGLFVLNLQLKPDAPSLLTGQNYSQNSATLTRAAQTFRNLREMSEHYELQPGKYIIIPCTYEPNQECDFLLRIFTENKAAAQ